VHSFDPEYAKEYKSVEIAVMIERFRHWIELNARAGRNIRDGRVWTFDSVQGIAVDFPYWTQPQVRYLLDKMVERGILLREQYSKTLDRRYWYAFKDQERFAPEVAKALAEGPERLASEPFEKTSKSICEKSQMHVRKVSDAFEKTLTCNKEQLAKHAVTDPPSGVTANAVTLEGAGTKTREGPPKGREPSDHQRLMAAYQVALGYKIRNGAAEGQAGKKLLAEGWAVEEIIECYHDLKAREFWQDQYLSLQVVFKQIAEWKQAQERRGNGITQRPTHRNGKWKQPSPTLKEQRAELFRALAED
jgi:hypothetical protein